MKTKIKDLVQGQRFVDVDGNTCMVTDLAMDEDEVTYVVLDGKVRSGTNSRYCDDEFETEVEVIEGINCDVCMRFVPEDEICVDQHENTVCIGCLNRDKKGGE